MTLTPVMRAALAVALTSILATSALAAPVPGLGTWTTTLQGRDIDRQAVSASSAEAVYLYDTALGVTWLRQAQGDAQLTWADALAWADGLVTGSGAAQVDDWRLPAFTGADPGQWNFAFAGGTAGFNVDPGSSELAHLFHVTLGNASAYDAAGNENAAGGLANTGAFANLLPANYWLGTALDADAAWTFDTGYGAQNPAFNALPFAAIAVRNGDVLAAAIPEPQTWALALAGLAALGAVARRRRG